jgi:uncharacterized OB-fold protein
VSPASRPIPEPRLPEAKPYWDGLRAGRLMLPSCPTCGPFFYPRPFCPRCHTSGVTWVQASGRGTLYSFAIAHQTFQPGFTVATPCVLALIELEEGPRLLSNLVEVEPDPRALRCGMPVEVVFERLTEDVSVPLFRPAPRVDGSVPP